MVSIIYDDENNMLTSKMRDLMHQAADAGLALEFAEEFKGMDTDAMMAEISVSICSDADIRVLNREYRGIDKGTDVLSFPQYGGHDELAEALKAYEEGPACLIGDVAICYDQAVRQADEYGTGLRREILYLFVHSLMHLFGYDHETADDKKIMREREENVLKKIAAE